jgi:hypothetical protein
MLWHHVDIVISSIALLSEDINSPSIFFYEKTCDQ